MTCVSHDHNEMKQQWDLARTRPPSAVHEALRVASYHTLRLEGCPQLPVRRRFFSRTISQHDLPVLLFRKSKRTFIRFSSSHIISCLDRNSGLNIHGTAQDMSHGIQRWYFASVLLEQSFSILSEWACFVRSQLFGDSGSMAAIFHPLNLHNGKTSSRLSPGVERRHLRLSGEPNRIFSALLIRWIPVSWLRTSFLRAWFVSLRIPRKCQGGSDCFWASLSWASMSRIQLRGDPCWGWPWL